MTSLRAYLTSFQFRIFVAMILITLIFVPAAGYIGYRQASMAIQEQMTQYADSTARQLELRYRALSSGMQNRIQLLQQMHKRTDLFFTIHQLEDTVGEVTVPKEHPLITKGVRILQQREQQAGTIQLDDRQYFAFTRQLQDSSDNIVLIFPINNYTKRLQLIRKLTVGFVIAAIILAAILSHLLSKSIMRPLLRLQQGIDRIGIGDLEHRVVIDEPDIARALAHSFNKMAVSLQKSLTELKTTYAELQEKEKLAVVGKMTAGIAHEIKNPLGIILGSTQVVLDRQRPWEMREKAASFIMDEVMRLDTTLKAFLDFARPATPVLVEANVAEVFEETLSAIEERYRQEGYTIRRDFARRLPLMEADPGQLRQILMNILLNAFTAMPDGGEVVITIRSEKEPEMKKSATSKNDKRFISTRNPFTVPRDWLIITIADNGCGMTTEQLNKIFDPFISFRSDGIGLGLSIVSQLVKLHRGYMEIDSREDVGTTFTLFFPCILKKTAAREAV